MAVPSGQAGSPSIGPPVSGGAEDEEPGTLAGLEAGEGGLALFNPNYSE